MLGPVQLLVVETSQNFELAEQSAVNEKLALVVMIARGFGC
jgi:hypothetical protein